MSPAVTKEVYNTFPEAITQNRYVRFNVITPNQKAKRRREASPRPTTKFNVYALI